MRDISYKRTITACYISFVVQAVVTNFTPLLFVSFRRLFGVSLAEISFLVSFNFIVQLLMDLLLAHLLPPKYHRQAIVGAQLFCALGLVSLALLPFAFDTPFTGLFLSVFFYAVGGGVIEVLASPMVEACPTENKEASMSLLHSFYCWGSMAAVLLSTLFFAAFGVENWRALTCLWALIPLANAFLFLRAPIASLEDGEAGMDAKALLTNGLFWLFFLVMVCGGASEHAMSQWASSFAETGLGVRKSVGDLAGPCAFALLMGVVRVWYAKRSESVPLAKAISVSALLCVLSFLLAALGSNPLFGLLGCALCGLSVALFWPGSLSLSAKALRGGGTRMFALLALGGDVGCSIGPALVGLVSASRGDDLHAGLLAAALFPALLLCALLLARRKLREGKADKTKLSSGGA